MRIAIASVLVGALAGCSGGCAIPPGFEPFGDQPTYEVIPTPTNAPAQ